MFFNNVVGVALALAVHARAKTADMELCIDANGSGDKCKIVTIPSDAFGDGRVFEVATGTLIGLLGGAPSAVRLLTPGTVCQFSERADSLGGCTGAKIFLASNTGQVNFPDGLNDNLGCVKCSG
ncbi:hypothetical protein LTR17_019183 [Elasticomyces elasticus]|nr:hypothetical protein LTR17_019183 [Elasticomyces elasticus]